MKTIFTAIAVLSIMVLIGFVVGYTQSGITGSVVAGSIVCSANDECNDGIGCTIDSCKNPGEPASFCTNQPVSYCKNDDGCCPAGCKSINDNDCK